MARTAAAARLNEAADFSHLQQIVAFLSEGVVLVDPDQTILWANEAALTMHGVTKLAELGKTVSEYRMRFRLCYRNNHPLDPGQYPIDRILAGETFAEVTVEVARAGQLEPEWVHQVRSLVLNDKQGQPNCLVLVIKDASARFEAEETFERAFNANPAPALICRLADLRFLKANQGFLDMTGFARTAIVGRSIYEFDIFKHAAHSDQAKERLAAGETVPQMEAELDLPDGSSKLVIVAGQTIELRDEPCMLFTFADLEPRRKAEKALRHSEERFVRAFQLAPVAMVVASLKEHRLFNANAAFHLLTGHADEVVVGRTPDDILLWDTGETRRHLERELAKKGSLDKVDAKLRTKGGKLLDCLVSAAQITVDDDPCILWVIQDITERRHSELELVTAIEAVMKDANWFSRNVVEKMANLRAQQNGAPLREVTELSKRERQVLEQVCQGLDDTAIASLLSMSRNTVRNHVARIYAKIGVNKRGAAIVWARERGLAHSDGTRQVQDAN